MIRLLLILFFLNLSILGCQAQDSTKFSKTFPKNQYLADIDTLISNLVNIHPSPYEFTSEEEFRKIVDDKKKQIDDKTQFKEFIWMCSEIVANINCGHTSLGWFNQEKDILPIQLMFPLEAKFIDNRLYVSDPLINSDRVPIGREIFSINGKDINSIKAEIYKHINTQGKNNSYKRLLLNGYVTSYIPYALGFPDSYSIIMKGELEPVQLNQLDNYSPKPRVSPKNECQENLCLKISKEKNLAIVTIRSFAYYGNKFPAYKTFIDDTFGKIKAEKIENLIIDIRMNDGGPSYAGIHLLKYLYHAPFKYWSHTAFEDQVIETYEPFETRFSGKLFVLLDGDCGSTTPFVLSHIKQNKLGLLIGEESNGNHLTFGGQKWFQLPNTGINYCVGRNKYISATSNFSKETGILPDHNVVQTIEEYLKEKDTVMEYAIDLIMKE